MSTRVLYICGLGSNAQGAKPSYLKRHFEQVAVPAVKHSSYAATKAALEQAVREFEPDIVVAHSAGVGKAVTLATSGAWLGPMVLLAGGNGCAPIADVTGRAITLVIPTRDPDAAAQRRVVRSAVDGNMVVAVEVEDGHDLNATMVDGDCLRSLVLEALSRHRRAAAAEQEEEAASFVAARQDAEIEQQIRFFFSECDLDEDGVLSLQDFENLIQRLSPSTTDSEFATLVQAVDVNGDNRIDVDEFVRWVFGAAGHGGGLATVLRHAATAGYQEQQPDEESGSVSDSSAAPVASAAAGGGTPAPAAAPPSQPAPAPAAEVEGEERPLAADFIAEVGQPAPGSTPVQPGQLFTWGRGSDGQLGQDSVRFPGANCALPHPVRRLSRVVHVAVGGGQQGCTAAVDADGALWTFGNNFKGRLGHGGEGGSVAAPRRVEALSAERVLMAACGPDHAAALVHGGGIYCWGANRQGQLGRGSVGGPATETVQPQRVELPAAAVQVDCEDQYTAAVLHDGRLLTWGCDGHGRLGIGGARGGHCPTPRPVETGVAVRSVSLGSLYAGAVGTGGELLMWGYGGHGNLGLGSRASVSTPSIVQLDEAATQVACTRGQEGCKGGLNPKHGGQEGPHTVVVAASGAMYTMGTCHKGLLANLGSKDGAFGKPWDELRPYRVGGPVRNGSSNAPLSPLAVWPPPYDQIGPVTTAVSAHIHAACVCADGRAWAWGCGSNDGRCGVERFLNMKGEGKPPEVDMMKCYMMGPHRIGVARRQYWKHPSLQGLRVSMLATGRNHMACIASLDDEAD